MPENPTLHVQVVSPEQILYEGDGEMLVCTTSDGDIAFLPGHTPLLGALGVAQVRVILPGQGEYVVAVHGGFVEVSGDRVIVLSAGPETHPIGEFTIDLPRPRDVAEIRMQPRFNELHEAIWQVLKSEVLKSYAQSRQ